MARVLLEPGPTLGHRPVAGWRDSDLYTALERRAMADAGAMAGQGFEDRCEVSAP